MVEVMCTDFLRGMTRSPASGSSKEPTTAGCSAADETFTGESRIDPQMVTLQDVEAEVTTMHVPEPRKGAGDDKALFPVERLVGLTLGVVLFAVFMCLEISDEHPRANDMVAILCLVASFWIFEVLPLPVTSLLPLVLLPFANIMSSKAVSASYWGWVQMLFVGAFIVDIAIEQVNLHRRIALAFLIKVGVGYPAIVALAFGTVSYFMSMWCSNTATTVMLTPFACGLLDTATRPKGSRESTERREANRRYTVGVLLTIAYSATAGGIATTIGTLPNGVLAGSPQVNNTVGATDWFAFGVPVSLLTFSVAFTTVYFIFLKGIKLELGQDVLLREYRALGPVSRDEIVVATVQLLQIFGWLTRKDLFNKALGIKSIGDDAIACSAAVVLFFIPSVKRQGESVLTWNAAQAHLPWGVLILMGGGFAIAKGFQESMLTNFIGEKLAGATSMGQLWLTYAIVFAICFLTEVTSNTATANIVLPILGGVATKTLTHPLALMLPATVACSFAFMLPAATPPNSVVFATGRLSIKDFIKAGFFINVLAILLCSPVINLMGSTVYGTSGPFPKSACLEESCRWVDVAGVVDGLRVPGQACLLLEAGACSLRNGTILRPAP